MVLIPAALGLLTPRAALATIATTIQVNRSGQNADGSGCTWKLSGSISYQWENGADHDRGFNNLVPVPDPYWTDDKDLLASIITDYNVKDSPPSIDGDWTLTYYDYPPSYTIYYVNSYTIPSATIYANKTYGPITDFAEADDIENAYLYVTSGQANPDQFTTNTNSAL